MRHEINESEKTCTHTYSLSRRKATTTRNSQMEANMHAFESCVTLFRDFSNSEPEKNWVHESEWANHWMSKQTGMRFTLSISRRAPSLVTIVIQPFAVHLIHNFSTRIHTKNRKSKRWDLFVESAFARVSSIFHTKCKKMATLFRFCHHSSLAGRWEALSCKILLLPFIFRNINFLYHLCDVRAWTLHNFCCSFPYPPISTRTSHTNALRYVNVICFHFVHFHFIRV